MLLAVSAGVHALAVKADEGQPIHVLVDGSTEMPQAELRNGRVVGGLQHDLAQEFGRRLQRPVLFRLVPRRRVAQWLAAGEQADLICNFAPAWLPGPLLWSQPFLQAADVLITASRRTAPRRIEELAGQPIGTIAGFHYPEVEAALGSGFVRDDATDLPGSLRKLAVGRVDHALVVSANFDYLRKQGQVQVELHPPLPVARLRTGCALSPHSRVTLVQLDAAIAAMQADGSLVRILDRYR